MNTQPCAPPATHRCRAAARHDRGTQTVADTASRLRPPSAAACKHAAAAAVALSSEQFAANWPRAPESGSKRDDQDQVRPGDFLAEVSGDWMAPQSNEDGSGARSRAVCRPDRSFGSCVTNVSNPPISGRSYKTMVQSATMAISSDVFIFDSIAWIWWGFSFSAGSNATAS